MAGKVAAPEDDPPPVPAAAAPESPCADAADIDPAISAAANATFAHFVFALS
jgi:hypothetical protein